MATDVIAPEHLDANERFVMCMSEAGYPPDEAYDSDGYGYRLWASPFPPREVVEKARLLAGGSGIGTDRWTRALYDRRSRHVSFGVAVRRSGS